MSKFKKGDRAKVNFPGHPRHGQACTITSDLWFSRQHRSIVDGVLEAWVYTTDFESTRMPGAHCSFREQHLEPYYDGNERVSWSSCVWQPSSERA